MKNEGRTIHFKTGGTIFKTSGAKRPQQLLIKKGQKLCPFLMLCSSIKQAEQSDLNNY